MRKECDVLVFFGAIVSRMSDSINFILLACIFGAGDESFVMRMSWSPGFWFW